MVARTFPQSHFLCNQPTYFERKILKGLKIHTIRANTKGHFKDGETLSLRVWTGLPYRSKQREFAQMTIHLEPVDIVCHSNLDLEFSVVGAEVDPLELILNDGLEEDAFMDWFFPTGPSSWSGDILHFTNLKYGSGQL